MPGKKRKNNEAVDGAAGGAGVPAKSGKAKTMLLAAGLVLVGAAGQRFVFSTPPQMILVAAPIDAAANSATAHSSVDCAAVLTDPAEGEAAPAAAAPHARASGSAAGSVELASQTINLADVGSPRYLKVGMALELGEGVVAEEFSTELAKASDVTLRYFSQKTVVELQGSTQIEQVRSQLTCLMQQAYAPEHDGEAEAEAEAAEPVVTEVLFTSFLIQ